MTVSEPARSAVVPQSSFEVVVGVGSVSDPSLGENAEILGLEPRMGMYALPFAAGILSLAALLLLVLGIRLVMPSVGYRQCITHYGPDGLPVNLWSHVFGAKVDGQNGWLSFAHQGKTVYLGSTSVVEEFVPKLKEEAAMEVCYGSQITLLIDGVVVRRWRSTIPGEPRTLRFRGARQNEGTCITCVVSFTEFDSNHRITILGYLDE